ncbi:MAG: hypothetical protein FVQ84_07670 [Planctomycetes bacterium]|nr:hypothetical protein [Planctomycetota bacterium]
MKRGIYGAIWVVVLRRRSRLASVEAARAFKASSFLAEFPRTSLTSQPESYRCLPKGPFSLVGAYNFTDMERPLSASQEL